MKNLFEAAKLALADFYGFTVAYPRDVVQANTMFFRQQERIRTIQAANSVILTARLHHQCSQGLNFHVNDYTHEKVRCQSKPVESRNLQSGLAVVSDGPPETVIIQATQANATADAVVPVELSITTEDIPAGSCSL